MSNDTAMRTGAGLLGLFAGALLGLIAYLVFLFAVEENASIAPWVFGGALAGFAIGFTKTQAGFALAEGLIHFLIGLFSSLGDRIVHPDADAPRWLKHLLWLGVFVGIAVAIWLHY